jgi:TLC domain
MANSQRGGIFSGLEARLASSSVGVYSRFHNLTHLKFCFHWPNGHFGDAFEGQNDVAQQVCSPSLLLLVEGEYDHIQCYMNRMTSSGDGSCLRLWQFKLVCCRVVSCVHAAAATALGMYWFLGSEEPASIGNRPFVFLPINAHIAAFGVGYFIYDFFAMISLRKNMNAGFFWGIMCHHIIFIVAYASTLVRSFLCCT